MVFYIRYSRERKEMINITIPGQMTEGELRGIEALARSAGPGACIVETGSLFGLSSYVWSMSAPPGSTVYCIDPWVREPWVINFVEKKIPGCPEFSRAEFERYTAECKNIVPIQGYSPKDCRGW